MAAIKLTSFKRVIPMIYAYNTIGVINNEGWTKIGYTERQTVQKRIYQQTHTAGVETALAWSDNAMYKDGSGVYFTDHEFHGYLEKKQVERRKGTEWFHVDGAASKAYFDKFASHGDAFKETSGDTYELRAEQEEAVEKTLSYLRAHGGKGEFLWNAKPRFGKTLTAYDFLRQLGAAKALIVTNRPSIANSWYEDFQKFIGWQTDFHFVSDAEALADKGVMTREAFTNWMLADDRRIDAKMVAFDSLQDLKGSVYFGGNFNKLQWIKDTDWDVLIVDEAHEGVDTRKTDRAFEKITRKFTLYLSGTPFKALASDRFHEDQIYNWSYADEQEAKENWESDAKNPYEDLPQLHMFTYRLSDMIRDRLAKGIQLDEKGEPVEYAFDLNEFFKAENGRLVHEEDVKKFLHALTTQEKYPFSTPELRAELKHTLWLLERVESAKALARLLKNDPVFSAYEVVLAAGDGKLSEEEENEKSYDKVKKAIENHDKTITLSVGQLTTGVTIPEWSGVLMLSNVKSPALYMQAAFRAQNPAKYYDGACLMKKENAYVFDFDPARTLIIYDEFANNLEKRTAGGSGTAAEHEQNIRRLLNFFPVIGEDSEGRMAELDAKAVLSIPRKLKSEEVVKCGFMNNFLFKNISNIFSAPAVVKAIVEKLPTAQEQKVKPKDQVLEDMDDVTVDADGHAKVPQDIVVSKTDAVFGPKIYGTLADDVKDPVATVGILPKTTLDVTPAMEKVKDAIKNTVRDHVVAPIVSQYGLTKGAETRLGKQVDKEIDRKLDTVKENFQQRTKIAEVEQKKALEQAETKEEVQAAEETYQAEIGEAVEIFKAETQKQVEEIIQNKPKELVEAVEQKQAEKKQNDIEETVRDHLRGFSRTIPSFIMAYGDKNLKLENFDQYVEDDVFKDVTGITMDDFRLLRDGGPYTDEETGEEKHFDGHLFDEVVFDDSVQTFWQKKEELADYFDESHDEDIFDYIPPQKTNQIFTPKKVVVQMVDMLEEENPGIFGDPNKTFADLYMKSGLYITEIVKRLYRNEAMKKKFPDGKKRLLHILTKQVYGCAPTEIIYRIATHYIFGAVPDMAGEMHNFRKVDTVPYAKQGKLQELIDQKFGK